MPSFRHLLKCDVWRQLCEIATLQCDVGCKNYLYFERDSTLCLELKYCDFGVLKLGRCVISDKVSVVVTDFEQCPSTGVKVWYLIQLYRILTMVFSIAMTISGHCQSNTVQLQPDYECIRIRFFKAGVKELLQNDYLRRTSSTYPTVRIRGLLLHLITQWHTHSLTHSLTSTPTDDSQPAAEALTYTNTQYKQGTNIHAPAGSKPSVADNRAVSVLLRRHGY